MDDHTLFWGRSVWNKQKNNDDLHFHNDSVAQVSQVSVVVHQPLVLHLVARISESNSLYWFFYVPNWTPYNRRWLWMVSQEQLIKLLNRCVLALEIRTHFTSKINGCCSSSSVFIRHRECLYNKESEKTRSAIWKEESNPWSNPEILGPFSGELTAPIVYSDEKLHQFVQIKNRITTKVPYINNPSSIYRLDWHQNLVFTIDKLIFWK